MNEKIITETKIKGDLIFDGKLIFEAGLGLVEIEGNVKASLGIEIRIGTNIRSGGYISSVGYISSGGYISSAGDISSVGYISSAGDISSGRDIRSGGDIRFSFHIRFKTKISCKLVRIAKDDNFEREYWAEKLLLYGFKAFAKVIQSGCCVASIRKYITDNKLGIGKRLLKCKWMFTERMAIQSWIDGELKDYKREV